jgi:hypothetical protein
MARGFCALVCALLLSFRPAISQTSISQRICPSGTAPATAGANITCGGTNCDGLPACSPSSGATSGSFSDVDGNYKKNANCWWLIATSLDAEIGISFPWYHTEGGPDPVNIYTCSSESSCLTCLANQPYYTSSCRWRGIMGGQSVLNVEVPLYTSTTGFLKVIFTSDNNVFSWSNQPGFSAAWSVVGACTNCTAGTYSPAPGYSSCLDCVAGKYSDATGASAASTCLDCAAGKYSAAPGASSCLDCVGVCQDSTPQPNSTTPLPPAISQFRCSPGTARAGATITCGGTNCGGLPACSPSSGATSGFFWEVDDNYKPYADCWWQIATSMDAEIRIQFPYFQTEPDYDWVEVLQCTDASCSTKTEVLKKSGTLEATNVYTSSTGFLKVIFTSGGSYDLLQNV